MSMPIIRAADPMHDRHIRALRDRLRSGGLHAASEAADLDVHGIVSSIIADVRSQGDRALVALEANLDHAALTPATLRVTPEEIAHAHRSADAEFLALVRRVVANIREYQQRILAPEPAPVVRDGRTLGVRYTPIDRVAVYVPGQRALYPSSVLMTVVPAQVAGVPEIAMASPPTTDGDIHPLVLALAGELGVTEVYRLGGAQAIAALALGTGRVRPVDKICGPGNAFVAEAKCQLTGQVGIDSVAGPSEVLIIADHTAPSDWVAADLIAQAEHDPGSAVLVTPSDALADAVVKAVDAHLPGLERGEAAHHSLSHYGAVVVVPDLDAACEVANDFAPEHMQIITATDDAVLAKIRNAGAIFVGAHTPVPLGDYYAGPSHVLPTGGTARFFGPLSANDFRKATSIIRYDADALAADADDVAAFANREGLTAHGAAVRIRAQQDGP
jgi:histidinol dehydrogenase